MKYLRIHRFFLPTFSLFFRHAMLKLHSLSVFAGRPVLLSAL